MVKINGSVQKLANVLRYFISYEFTFVTANTRNLWHAMSAADQRIFNFDMSSLRWQECLARVAVGLKKFLMKEGPETIPHARMLWNR